MRLEGSQIQRRQAPNFRTISKPNKTNHLRPKKPGPTLHAINPQKRTMEETLQGANSMEEIALKTVAHAKEAGCPILDERFSRQGWDKQMPAPSLSLPLPRRPKTPRKVYKSVQKAPGNHPPTITPSTT
jgi:hypothetical protein